MHRLGYSILALAITLPLSSCDRIDQPATMSPGASNTAPPPTPTERTAPSMGAPSMGPAAIAPAKRAAPPIAAEFVGPPFTKADRIEVGYAPDADWASKLVKRFELTDAATLRAWVDSLATVASKPARVMKAKLRATSPEFRVTFFQGQTALGTLRIKASKLSAPGHGGWTFYADRSDRAFVALVKALVKP